MGKPLTFRQAHIRKGCLEGRILRTAGIDAKADGSTALVHMTNAHLAEPHTVLRTFDAVIILPAAEAVPHGLDGGVDGGGGPVGIAQIRCNTSQMLELLVFVFNGAFQPVFAVQLHHHTALVEAVLALKGCLDDE